MSRQPLVDSHCHLNLYEEGENEYTLERILQRATEEDVAWMLCASVDLEGLPGILDMARRHRQVFASVGVHPNTEAEAEPEITTLVELAADPGVVAIGETGLDYFRSKGDLEWQRERFRTHIRAAIEAELPLIIHTREAREDVIRLLREESAERCGGVMHCFVEDWDTAVAALDLGFYISFSGILTFRNAEELRDVARKVPLDRVLVETDSPYLAPMPYRGKTNQPAYVRKVAECLAELRGMTVDGIAERTTENFFTLFPCAARERTSRVAAS